MLTVPENFNLLPLPGVSGWLVGTILCCNACDSHIKYCKGGGGGGGGVLFQKINLKMELNLKGTCKGRIISLFLHQKCLKMLTAVATKSQHIMWCALLSHVQTES